MSVKIRTAVDADSQSICDIYNHYVDCSTCTFDLPREPLAQRIEWLDVAYFQLYLNPKTDQQ